LPAPAANIFLQVTPDDEARGTLDTAEDGDEVEQGCDEDEEESGEEDEDSTGEMQSIWEASNQNGQAATVTHSLAALASALRDGLDAFYRERTPVPPSRDANDRTTHAVCHWASQAPQANLQSKGSERLSFPTGHWSWR
jgi:hypothetical protein